MGNLHTVGKREECIRCHHGSVKVEVERMSLVNGLPERVDTRGLPHPCCTELPVLGKYYGVAFAMLHELVGKQQVGHPVGCNGGGGHSAQVIRRLHQRAVENRTELARSVQQGFLPQDYAVLLLLKNTKCLGSIGRGDYYLEEYLVDFLGHGCINVAVCDEHTAERRYRVACKGLFPGFKNAVARSHAAGIVMFQNRECRLCEFSHQRCGGINVKQVVVRDFLAVQLLEQLVETTEEIALLVRILAVAHRFFAVDCHTQCRRLLSSAVEIVEYGAIVRRRYSECLLRKPAAVGQRGLCTFFGKDTAQRLILVLGGYDYNIVEILGRATNQRYSAYVNFLYDIIFGCTRCNCFLKRIEVNYHQVDAGNFIFHRLLTVGGIVASIKDSTEHLRV